MMEEINQGLQQDNESSEQKELEQQENVKVEAAFVSAIVEEKEPINLKDQSTNEVIPQENDTFIEFNKNLSQVKRFEKIFDSIEEAFPKGQTYKEFLLPHPRGWLGPRFMAIWVLPIIFIIRLRNLFTSLNPVRPYKENAFLVEQEETIFTATRKSLDGSSPMRFFGIRFIAIWVLPLAITGIVMEVLFVSPLTGRTPFG